MTWGRKNSEMASRYLPFLGWGWDLCSVGVGITPTVRLYHMAKVKGFYGCKEDLKLLNSRLIQRLSWVVRNLIRQRSLK